MKLLGLIRPYFGAIRICGAFLGDSRKEDALDNYDRVGQAQLDANYHLFARLDLDDIGIEDAKVRFEYNEEDKLTRIALNVVFTNETSLRRSRLWILRDYLSQSEFFEDSSDDEQNWTFWNGINEIHCEESEEELFLELYSPWDTRGALVGEMESSVLTTISRLARDESDDWFDFVKECSAKKYKLYYRREPEEYPELWTVLSEEEYKNGPTLSVMHLTEEALERIMVDAGWTYVPHNDKIILDPISLEPMDMVKLELIEGAKPMTDEQLSEAIDEIDYLDRERTSYPE